MIGAKADGLRRNGFVKKTRGIEVDETLQTLAPQDLAPQDSASQDLAPQDLAPQDLAPQDECM